MDLWQVSMFYGVAGTAVEGIGLLFPTRQSMKKPSDFRMLFLLTAGGVIAFYLIFGLTGVFVVSSLTQQALGSTSNEVVFLTYGMEYRALFYIGIVYGLVDKFLTLSVCSYHAL
jgi:threonine/homoserine efflux transporter RhtA